MKRIAVIGGGISGLAAALLLTRRGGYQVTLFEASDHLGGVLQTVRDGPYLVERSADNFATVIPDAWELSKTFELESELIRPATDNRQAFVLHAGRVLPIPAGFSLMQPTRVGSILATQTLSWSAKLRLLWELWTPRRDSEEDESLESFSIRRLGRETYENLVEPIVSGIFTADPATLSMRATLPQFVEMERRDGGLIRGYWASRKKDATAAARRASGARYDQFVAPKLGMSSWVDALAEKLPADCLRLNTPVASVQQRGDGAKGWKVSTLAESFHFDAVICSAPAAATARQLETSIPKAASILAGIPYASSAVVALVVNRSELTGRIDGFGLIVPRKEGRETLAISFASNKYAGRAPEGEILMRLFFGGALHPEAVDKSDRQLGELAVRELREILGWTGSMPNWQAVIRWREAMPQYVVGHLDRMRQLESCLAHHPGLKLCGAAYTGVGIPQCVRGARRAVEELFEYFE